MVSSIIFLLLSAAPAPAATAPVRPTTVDVLVTDRYGKPLQSAHVVVDGVSEREGDTDASGHVMFRNMTAGTYKLQVERDAFITLQKEFMVRPGSGSVAVLASLSPGGAAAARATMRTSINPVGNPGSPQILSIPDLAEKRLIGRDAVKESPIGCSGMTNARLTQVSEPFTEHTHADAEEMLYVIAGEGILRVAGKTEIVKSGWFSIIPRGTTYALGRKGRNPVIVLSVLGGQPCAPAVPTQAAR
jgi:hypothetical protein